MTASAEPLQPMSASQPRLPDFFIVGQPKSGTTALYSMLRRHPQIYLPETKEPGYVPPDDAKAEDAIAGDHPFVMQADGRAWLYRATASREAYVTELMLHALDQTGDRSAALASFARRVSDNEARVLRRALETGGDSARS